MCSRWLDAHAGDHAYAFAARKACAPGPPVTSTGSNGFVDPQVSLRWRDVIETVAVTSQLRAPISVMIPASVAASGSQVAIVPSDEPAPVEVMVPATGTTVMRWAQTWVRMCAAGNLLRGPLNDDERARTVYDLSAEQLRNVRNAALSGALARKAADLSVELSEACDVPSERIKTGHEFTRTAAMTDRCQRGWEINPIPPTTVQVLLASSDAAPARPTRTRAAVAA